MIRAVPDTNIWVASIRWRGRPYQIRKLGEAGKVTLVASPAILAELTRILRQHFELTDEEAYGWYCQIGMNVEIVLPTRRVDAVPEDPDDNKFVECALEGDAAYIISRDDDLLRFRPIRRCACGG